MIIVFAHIISYSYVFLEEASKKSIEDVRVSSTERDTLNDDRNVTNRL